ncbi:MAG: RNA 2',3'-cyclic phosphodiesterase [Candidatus Micrarchaeota archaeon]|nr:RNA 2',3'-cyclic phosphodiesterase [Candidatus Micrarchaeota archaeon]
MQGQHQEHRETRAFIAIDIPQEVKERLRELLASSGIESLRPVHEDNMHLTLLFIGNLDPALLEKARSIVSELRGKSFRVSLKGLGTFSRSHPRVVFARVGEGVEQLKALHSALHSEVKAIGVELEGREYTPHLTVSRLGHLPRNQLAQLTKFLDDKADLEIGSFLCSAIKLKSSIIGGERAVHGDLAVAELSP